MLSAIISFWMEFVPFWLHLSPSVMPHSPRCWLLTCPTEAQLCISRDYSLLAVQSFPSSVGCVPVMTLLRVAIQLNKCKPSYSLVLRTVVHTSLTGCPLAFLKWQLVLSKPHNDGSSVELEVADRVYRLVQMHERRQRVGLSRLRLFGSLKHGPPKQRHNRRALFTCHCGYYGFSVILYWIHK